MKSLPVQERALKKRVALLKAAVQEFGVAGFEASTAKSIAARASVATGTFYQYFENKNDILRVIAENRFANLHEQVSILEALDLEAHVDGEKTARAESLFRRVLTFLYEFHIQDALLHQVLDQRRGLDPQLNTIMSRGEDLMRSHVVEFIKEYDLDDPEIVADSLFAMGEGLVHRMVFGGQPENPEKMLATGSSILACFLSKNTS